jgi:serine/threonine-protein kinase
LEENQSRQTVSEDSLEAVVSGPHATPTAVARPSLPVLPRLSPSPRAVHAVRRLSGEIAAQPTPPIPLTKKKNAEEERRGDTPAVPVMFQEPSVSQPTPFGGYELIRRIGAGGMGEVFLARERHNGQVRACVVKKVLPSLQANRAFVGRFLDEAKVVVRLNHANVARVYAMGEVDGEYYLTMEYVQGKTVSRFTKRLRDRKQHMPLGLILLIGERVCTGLQYAHDANDERGEPLHLVHRDLSPANVCISYRGDVKIIDFGAAQSTLKEEQTAPRVVIGNLTYMAPEQAKKQFVDRRADVYSTGVMLWELLAWHALPQKGDPIERWRKAANPTWAAPSAHNPHVPPELDSVILKALRKDPDARFRSAGELGAELKAIRMRLAPNVSEADLGALLSSAFAREKSAEDGVLAETLGKGASAIENAPTDKSKRMNLVPPTALAFEHTAVLAEEVPSEDELTDPGRGAGATLDAEGTPTPSIRGKQSEPVELTRLKKRTFTGNRPALDVTRRSFGVHFDAHEPVIERSLVEEIDALSDETSGPEYETSTYGGRSFAVIGIGVFLAAVGLGFLGVWLWANYQP